MLAIDGEDIPFSFFEGDDLLAVSAEYCRTHWPRLSQLFQRMTFINEHNCHEAIGDLVRMQLKM